MKTRKLVSSVRELISSLPFFVLIVIYVFAGIAILSRDSVSIDGLAVETLASSSNIVWSLVSLSLASGICAMAVVQCWKIFLRPRARFHKKVLTETFGPYFDTIMELTAPGFGEEVREFAAEEFVIRRRFDGRLEFLDSPAEVVMAQLAEAAEYSLRNPKRYMGLNQILVGDTLSGERRGPDSERRVLGAEDARYFLDKNLQLLHVQLHEMWRYRVRAASVFVSSP